MLLSVGGRALEDLELAVERASRGVRIATYERGPIAIVEKVKALDVIGLSVVPVTDQQPELLLEIELDRAV